MDDSEYEDYLYDLGPLQHVPVRPPRAGFIGETVFAERWAKYMAEAPRHGYDSWRLCPNARLAEILSELPSRISQRHATVCASIVCWLGTNCGHATLDEAKKLGAMMFPGYGYIAAWAIENKRSSHVNRGVRCLEHLLAPEDHYGKCIFTGALVLQRRPDLTVEDYETAEHLWSWLASDPGRAFVQGCERVITKRQAAEYRQMRATAGEPDDVR